ncbi:MAG: hypothetical protein FWG18_03005, partial [Alphaproteobacteria bacterium]|nr:hypothetical protein [Alphaproteobacteria bacterium]
TAPAFARGEGKRIEMTTAPSNPTAPSHPTDPANPTKIPVVITPLTVKHLWPLSKIDALKIRAAGLAEQKSGKKPKEPKEPKSPKPTKPPKKTKISADDGKKSLDTGAGIDAKPFFVSPDSLNILNFIKSGKQMWPSPDEFVAKLQKLSAADSITPEEARKLGMIPVVIDTIYYKSHWDIDNHFVGGYNDITKSVHLNFVKISDEYSKHQKDYDRAVDRANKINRRLAIHLIHEVLGHGMGDTKSKLGFTVKEIEEFYLNDEMWSLAAEMIAIREVFLATGDLLGAFAVADIYELPVTTFANDMRKGYIETNLTGVPKRYANWLHRNKAKVLKERHMGPEEARELFLCTVEMFETIAKMGYLESHIPGRTLNQLRKTNGIYAQHEAGREVTEELIIRLTGGEMETFEKIMGDMWSFTVEGEDINIRSMLTDKDFATMRKILDNKKFSALMKKITASVPGFDDKAKRFLNEWKPAISPLSPAPENVDIIQQLTSSRSK